MKAKVHASPRRLCRPLSRRLCRRCRAVWARQLLVCCCSPESAQGCHPSWRSETTATGHVSERTRSAVQEHHLSGFSGDRFGFFQHLLSGADAVQEANQPQALIAQHQQRHFRQLRIATVTASTRNQLEHTAQIRQRVAHAIGSFGLPMQRADVMCPVRTNNYRQSVLDHSQ